MQPSHGSVNVFLNMIGIRKVIVFYKIEIEKLFIHVASRGTVRPQHQGRTAPEICEII